MVAPRKEITDFDLARYKTELVKELEQTIKVLDSAVEKGWNARDPDDRSPTCYQNVLAQWENTIYRFRILRTNMKQRFNL